MCAAAVFLWWSVVALWPFFLFLVFVLWCGQDREACDHLYDSNLEDMMYWLLILINHRVCRQTTVTTILHSL